MQLKRLLLAAISLGFGFVSTTIITWAMGTTPAEYGAMYFALTSLCLAIFLGIWLDKFMKTEILPE